jgi:hypothetical protein
MGREVSGQQSTSRIFVIDLASLAKMSGISAAAFGSYATIVSSISMDSAAAARALIQCVGSRFFSSSDGGWCMILSNTHSK